jgi:nicotinate-nucleotide adenylyltransferase
MHIVYGGTFDPVHIGHLRLAFEALEELKAARLCFLPCDVPVHRPEPMAPSETRAKWLAAAIENVPGFALDDRELLRAGPSFSIETVRELRHELGPTTPLVWLIGEDALKSLPSWHRADELWQYTHFAVLKRPTTLERADLKRRFEGRVVAPQALADHAFGNIAWLNNTEIDISATAVRARLHRGLSARFLVPEVIRAEIEACASDQGKRSLTK